MLMAASVGAVLCVPLFLSSSAFTSLGSTASQTEWHGVSLGRLAVDGGQPGKAHGRRRDGLASFWMFDQFEAPSELDFITQLRQEHGDAYAITTMQNHWDRYISDTQLDEAQKLGINAVRIPVGYWIMDSPAAGSGKGGAFKGSPLEYGISPEGFVTGGLNHLRSMLIKLKQRKMVALVDVHSLPCNSGCISDGMSCKAPLAFGNPDGTPAAIADMPRCYGGFYKTTRTASASESSWGDVGVNSVAALAAWLAALPDEAQSVCAFQLANEPALGPPGIYDDAVAEFYARAHAKVRSHLPSTPLIFSFMGPSKSAIKLLKESNSKASVTAEKGGAGLPAEVLADHHYYLNWQSPVGEDLPWDEIHRRACVREAEGAAHAVDFYAENSLPLIVGEWSLAVNHDIKHDLTDKKVVENLSKLFKEQVYAFTTSRRSAATSSGRCVWDRVGTRGRRTAIRRVSSSRGRARGSRSRSTRSRCGAFSRWRRWASPPTLRATMRSCVSPRSNWMPPASSWECSTVLGEQEERDDNQSRARALLEARANGYLVFYTRVYTTGRGL